MEKTIINRPKEDFESVDFGDKRLKDRLQKMVEDSTKNAQKSILGSSGGRNQAKAFYRLLSKDKFEMDELMSSATAATYERLQGTVLLVQVITDINLNGHIKTEGLGYSSEHVLGIKVHSCIAISPEGIAYGLMDQSYETREESKSPLTNAEKDTPKITINLLRITELTPLAGQEPIEWILATSLELNCFNDAMTVVEYYIQCWKIERFHYVLKSGMGAENIQQRTYERIKPVLLIYSVIALYIMTLTYMGRTLPDALLGLISV